MLRVEIKKKAAQSFTFSSSNHGSLHTLSPKPVFCSPSSSSTLCGSARVVILVWLPKIHLVILLAASDRRSKVLLRFI
ncbi:uncharacterized protein DS421_1g10160 [Arachis hypogaea]|nr:uncharacterized protein DS421_1g10160 [Arachis hypogaea]